MPGGRRPSPEARGTAAGGRALPPPSPSASSFVASSRPLFLPPPPSPGPLPRSLSSCLAFLRRRRLIYYKCTFGADISDERRASADERSLRAARPKCCPPGSAEPPAGRGKRSSRAGPPSRRLPGPAADPGRRPRTPRPHPRTAPEFLHDCHKGKRPSSAAPGTGRRLQPQAWVAGSAGVWAWGGGSGVGKVLRALLLLPQSPESLRPPEDRGGKGEDAALAAALVWTGSLAPAQPQDCIFNPCLGCCIFNPWRAVWGSSVGSPLVRAAGSVAGRDWSWPVGVGVGLPP